MSPSQQTTSKDCMTSQNDVSHIVKQSVTHLIFVTWSLAVLSQALEALINESHVSFIDVQTKQS